MSVFQAFGIIVILYCLIPVTAFAAVLVLGILIAVNKVKPTKILGIGYIFSAVPILSAVVPQLISRFLGVAALARLGVAISLTGTICSLAFSLCICLFIHKRYGKKLIYIPVLAVPVVGNLASVIVASLLNRSGASGMSLGVWISLTRDINSFVTGTVASLAVIIVLFLNRNKEDIVPKLWLFRIIIYAWSAVSFVYRVVYYVTMLIGTGAVKLSTVSFMRQLARNYELISAVMSIISALVAVIIPIYVFVSVCKYSRNTETTGSEV